jgi:hypothetical protein
VWICSLSYLPYNFLKLYKCLRQPPKVCPQNNQHSLSNSGNLPSRQHLLGFSVSGNPWSEYHCDLTFIANGIITVTQNSSVSIALNEGSWLFLPNLAGTEYVFYIHVYYEKYSPAGITLLPLDSKKLVISTPNMWTQTHGDTWWTVDWNFTNWNYITSRLCQILSTVTTCHKSVKLNIRYHLMIFFQMSKTPLTPLIRKYPPIH